MPEPTGVVVVLSPDLPALLPLVSLVSAAVLSGNCVVALASDKYPLPAAAFGEILATSDLPGGVVNVLTGRRVDLVSHIASHMDVNAVLDAVGMPELKTKLQEGTAMNLKRYANRALPERAWFTEQAEAPGAILDTVEFKTAWHPIGL